MHSARQRLALLFAPPGPTGRRITALALTTLVAALAALHASKFGEPMFPVDDAYISLHNAEVLVSAGPDTEFVGTPALVGSTSAVHVALIAVFLSVMPPLWALWTVMFLGVLAYALATLRLAFVLRASIPEALLMVAASVLVSQTPHQLLNGLETGWALAGLTFAIAAARSPVARPWELPIACGLLPFLRPELVAVSGLLMLVRVFGDLRAGGLRAALRSAGYFAAAALPWLLLYLVTTGTLYPNTIEAKRNFFAEGCWVPEMRLAKVRDAFLQFREGIGYFTYAAVLLSLTITGWVGLIFSAVFAYAYYERLPGALEHYEQRYMYVLIPWLIYATGQLISWQKLAPRLLASALFSVCIWQAYPQLGPRWDFHQSCLYFTRAELDPLASWLDAHAHGQKLLLHDAGYVGFYVDAPMADMVGLKTPASIEPHRALTWTLCGGAARNAAIHQIAMHEQPKYVVLLAGWDQIYGISQGLRAHGWQLEPRYQHFYVVYEVTGKPAL
jgi:hypothetical protein